MYLEEDPTSDDDTDYGILGEAECVKKQRARIMREFLRSDRVLLHPSASCEMKDFFAAFDAHCRDREIRPFKTSWKAPWNEANIHLVRRRGSKRLMGVEASPSPAALSITDNQNLAFVRASLGNERPRNDDRMDKFPWTV